MLRRYPGTPWDHYDDSLRNYPVQLVGLNHAILSHSLAHGVLSSRLHLLPRYPCSIFPIQDLALVLETHARGLWYLRLPLGLRSAF